MFPEESDRVEKYIGGLPETIHDSVKATRPKTMPEAIEFTTELMDKKIRDVVEKNGSLRVLLETIRTSHNRIRGRALVGPMPQAIVTGIYTQGLNLYVPSVITIMKVIAHLGAIIAKGLAI
uniref:Reverse transcriptase domain-containing protein n=1 Tax=Tanacetum cinerariifolium TaxID=118510 RepID=A0A699VSZ1_TANCI|nr:hypothetical protein [Tanacetum cinerariifolium]